MRAVVDSSAFTAALKDAARVLGASPIPELSEVRAQFSDGRCVLTATDLTTWLTAELPATGNDFSFLFSNTKNLVKACRYYSGEITFELNGDEKNPSLQISCGDKGGISPVHSDRDYPVFPMVEGDTVICDADVLYRRVERIRYAAAGNASRPELSGVRFQDERIWCVDGYRAAVSRNAALRVEWPFILPAEALRNLRVFGTHPVKIQAGTKCVCFSGKERRLMIKSLEAGDRLDLDSVMAERLRGQYRICRSEFLEALRYLKEFVRTKGDYSTAFVDGRLVIQTAAGQYSADLGLGPACRIETAFDLRFMKEALEQFDGAEYVTLQIADAPMPIFLSEDSGENTALVLPVRLRKENLRQIAA